MSPKNEYNISIFSTVKKCFNGYYVYFSGHCFFLEVLISPIPLSYSNYYNRFSLINYAFEEIGYLSTDLCENFRPAIHYCYLKYYIFIFYTVNWLCVELVGSLIWFYFPDSVFIDFRLLSFNFETLSHYQPISIQYKHFRLVNPFTQAKPTHNRPTNIAHILGALLLLIFLCKLDIFCRNMHHIDMIAR